MPTLKSSGTERVVPKAARELRKDECSRIVGRIVNDGNATEIADDLGVSRALLRAWAEPDKDAGISVADAAGLPADGRMALAEYVAGPGFIVAELPAAESSRAGIELHLRALTETTEAIAAHARAIADGRVDRAEGAALERETDDAIRVLLAVRECARQAQREGVIGCDVVSIARAR